MAPEEGGGSQARQDTESVRAQLDRILASPEFLAPERGRRFLQYIVEETLEGHAGQLKAFRRFFIDRYAGSVWRSGTMERGDLPPLLAKRPHLRGKALPANRLVTAPLTQRVALRTGHDRQAFAIKADQ